MKTQLEQARIFNATSLTNFEIQKYYQNGPKFNSTYSRNNLLKTNDGAYIQSNSLWAYSNLDEYEVIGTQWIALYVNGNNMINFDSIGGEHIPKEIITKI